MSLRDEVRTTLQAFGLRLNTDLGQHFLVDEDALQTILDAAELDESDHVVEIGPGIGILTRELVQDAGHVTAIEIDPRFIPIVQQFAARDPEMKKKLTVILGNALAVPLPTEPYKIVANIPYHITSPLMRHAFVESPVKPTTMTVLIQREVAEKICDTGHGSMLTVIVGLFGTPSIVAHVHANQFLPPPKVDSSILHIITHPKPLADAKTIEQIFRLTKVAFGQKRKMLRNSFGTIPEGLQLLEKAGIDPTRRPETLSIEEWIEIANALPA